MSLSIYSGRGLDLLFTMEGNPNKLVAQFTPSISDRTYYEIANRELRHYKLKFPFIAEVKGVAQDQETERVYSLMEQMLSKFDAFGEALSAVREDVNSMKPDLHAVKEDVAVLKTAARTHTDAIKANTEAIRAMQSDLKNINQRLELVEAKVTS